MAGVAAWYECQLRKYDFPTNQLPRSSCKDKTVYELLKAGVSVKENPNSLIYAANNSLPTQAFNHRIHRRQHASEDDGGGYG